MAKKSLFFILIMNNDLFFSNSMSNTTAEFKIPAIVPEREHYAV